MRPRRPFRKPRGPASSNERIQWAIFIRQLLDRLGWTNLQMAHYIGCSAALVCRWIDRDPVRGRRPSPLHQTLLVQLAKNRGLLGEQAGDHDVPDA